MNEKFFIFSSILPFSPPLASPQHPRRTGRFPLRATHRPTGPGGVEGGGGGGGTALVLLDYFQEILAGSSSTSVGLDELVKAQSDFMEVT